MGPIQRQSDKNETMQDSSIDREHFSKLKWTRDAHVHRAAACWWKFADRQGLTADSAVDLSDREKIFRKSFLQ